MFNFFGSRNLPYSEMSPQSAAEKIGNQEVMVVDVREPNEYAQGHIAGSLLIPLGQLSHRVEELGNKEREIIMVCRSGNRSSYAAEYLAGQGFNKIANLSGGMVAWLRAGMPVER